MATFPRGHSARSTSTRNQSLKTTLDRQSTTSQGRITWIITAADSITLRGIPAIGRGVAGAIPHTQPHGALGNSRPE